MIIVGLGNPGKEYEHTRHNVGFRVVESLDKRLQSPTWKEEFGARWTKSGSHWLIEPWQFMNTSGPILKTFLEKKGVSMNAQELLVIHDDVDFPLGELHEQFNRSAAGHNGVQSIIDVFGQRFSRMRIGIGNNRDANIPAEDYVLEKFSADEQVVIGQAVDQAVELVARKILT